VNRVLVCGGAVPFTVHRSPFTVRDGGGTGLVVRPVFKTATEAPPAAPVGSIPTRSRHLRLRLLYLLIALLVICLFVPDVQAQATPQPRRPTVPRTDTLQVQYISPLGAFWRSFLLPGWGQARLNRKLTGGLFVAWEGVTLGMSLKTLRELRYLRRTNSARGDRKRQEHEDWLVLLAFNHLFAGLEAYVSAHLSDFPGDLRMEAVPGGAGVGISIPIRVR
jgi:hypothetical protein